MRIKRGRGRKFTGGVRYLPLPCRGERFEQGGAPLAAVSWIGPRVPPDRELGEHDLRLITCFFAKMTIRSHSVLPFEEG
jgi:hypothetical protein